MRIIRIVSGCLALMQLGWAAALIALGSAAPLWAVVTGAVIGAIGTAAPGVLEKMVAP